MDAIWRISARNTMPRTLWLAALTFWARLRRHFQKLKKQLVTALIDILSRRSRLHMGSGHKRTDLRANAQAKLDDAITLSQKGGFSNAYYLAGYAVEIGLKACIAAKFVAEVIPDKTFVNDIYVHNLTKLVGLADLSQQLKEAQEKDQKFAENWALVVQWDESKRYVTTDANTAQTTIEAITDPISGVFAWIKVYW